MLEWDDLACQATVHKKLQGCQIFRAVIHIKSSAREHVPYLQQGCGCRRRESTTAYQRGISSHSQPPMTTGTADLSEMAVVAVGMANL